MTTIYQIEIATSETEVARLPELFENRGDANDAGKGAGWHGSNGTACEVHVFSSLDEYQRYKKDKAKAEALAKLTDADRKALGLL